MTDKPTKKTDLSAFGTGSLDVLKAGMDKSKPEVSPVPKPARTVKRGPAPRPETERRSESVNVRLTPDERKRLEDQAGDVPLSVFIVRRLQDAGII